MHPRLPPFLVVAALGLGTLFGLAACHPSASELLVWRRADLWSLPTERKKPLRRVTAYLGAASARDLEAPTPEQRARAPQVSAGEIRALEQVAGQTLRWQLELGREPYFTFIPLRNEQWPCRCTYRVSVLPADGDRQEVLSHLADETSPPAPATVTVDLTAWAGQPIDLILDLDAPADATTTPAPRGLWASPAIWGRYPAAFPGADATHPNVLFLGVDTLRTDALGAWGRQPSLSPAMDRLAAESDVWSDAFTCFNVTNPSFVSMMTGLYGKHHGVWALKTPVGAAAETLAESFSAGGWDTYAVISAHHLGNHNSGLDQGFAKVVLADGQLAGEMAVDTFTDWLAGRDATGSDKPVAAKPFFAWLHLFDAHTPYTPPRPYALGYAARRSVGLSPLLDWTHFREPGLLAFTDPVLGGHRDLYAGEVAYIDRQVDRLLGFLDSRRLLESTIVVLVADHGESLDEHGIHFRHAGLYDTTTHVPLMIRWPGPPGRGRRLAGLVQTLDLYPTLLAAAGLPVPTNDGVDLRELTAPGKNGRRLVFADHSERQGVMVRSRTHKYITSHGNAFIPDGAYLYDLTKDPGEVVNLAGQGLPVEAEMARLLAAWQADVRRGIAAEPDRLLSAEEQARLKALGYL